MDDVEAVLREDGDVLAHLPEMAHAGEEDRAAVLVKVAFADGDGRGVVAGDRGNGVAALELVGDGVDGDATQGVDIPGRFDAADFVLEIGIGHVILGVLEKAFDDAGVQFAIGFVVSAVFRLVDARFQDGESLGGSVEPRYDARLV